MLNKYNTDKLNCMGRLKILLKYCILVCLFIGFFTSIVQTSVMIYLEVEGVHNVTTDTLTQNEFGEIYFTTLKGYRDQESRELLVYGEEEYSWAEIITPFNSTFEESSETPNTCSGIEYLHCITWHSKALREEGDRYPPYHTTSLEAQSQRDFLAQLEAYGHAKVNISAPDPPTYLDHAEKNFSLLQEYSNQQLDVGFRLNPEVSKRYKPLVIEASYGGPGLFMVVLPKEGYVIDKIEVLNVANNTLMYRFSEVNDTSPRCTGNFCTFDYDDNVFKDCLVNTSLLNFGDHFAWVLSNGQGAFIPKNKSNCYPLGTAVNANPMQMTGGIGNIFGSSTASLMAYPVTQDSIFFTRFLKSGNFAGSPDETTEHLFSLILTNLHEPDPSLGNRGIFTPTIDSFRDAVNGYANPGTNSHFSNEYYSKITNISSVAPYVDYNTDVFDRNTLPVMIAFMDTMRRGEYWLDPIPMGQFEGEAYRDSGSDMREIKVRVIFRQDGHSILVDACDIINADCTQDANYTTSNIRELLPWTLTAASTFKIYKDINSGGNINNPTPKYGFGQTETLIFGGYKIDDNDYKDYCIHKIQHGLRISTKNSGEVTHSGFPTTYKFVTDQSPLPIGISRPDNNNTIENQHTFSQSVTMNGTHSFKIDYFKANLTYGVEVNSDKAAYNESILYHGYIPSINATAVTTTPTANLDLNLREQDRLIKGSQSELLTCGFPASLHKFTLPNKPEYYLDKITKSDDLTIYVSSSNGSLVEYDQNTQEFQFRIKPVTIYVYVTDIKNLNFKVFLEPYPKLTVNNVTDATKNHNLVTPDEGHHHEYTLQPNLPNTVSPPPFKLSFFERLDCLDILKENPTKVIARFTNDSNKCKQGSSQPAMANTTNTLPTEGNPVTANVGTTYVLKRVTGMPNDQNFELTMDSITENITINAYYYLYNYIAHIITRNASLISNLSASNPTIDARYLLPAEDPIGSNTDLVVNNVNGNNILNQTQSATYNATPTLYFTLGPTDFRTYSRRFYYISSLDYVSFDSNTPFELSSVPENDSIDVLLKPNDFYYLNYTAQEIRSDRQYYLGIDPYKSLLVRVQHNPAYYGTKIAFKVNGTVFATHNVNETFFPASIPSGNFKELRVTPNKVTITANNNNLSVGFRHFDSFTLEVFPDTDGSTLDRIFLSVDKDNNGTITPLNETTQYVPTPNPFGTFSLHLNPNNHSNNHGGIPEERFYELHIQNVSHNIRLDVLFTEQEQGYMIDGASY
jgi:hypothetical protein